MGKNTPIETTDTTPRTKTLANGAVYDLDKGRIVANPGGGSHAITSDNAHDMIRLRVAKKRAAVQAAALDAVQNGGLLTKYGDLAWVAEVTQAQMMLATQPEAGKASTIAAEWLLTNAGMGEKQQEAPQSASVTVTHSIDRDTAALLAAIAHAQQREVVDGLVMAGDEESEEAGGGGGATDG